MSRLPNSNPLEYGREVAHVTLGSGQFPGAATRSYSQPMKSSAALVSVWAEANAGTLTVRIYSVTDNMSDNQHREVLRRTETLIGPTTELQIYRVDDIAGGSVRVEVESDAAADILLKVKAAHTVGTSSTPSGVQDTIQLNSLVSVDYDGFDVTSRNSCGSPLTVDYKKGGSTVGTLTLTYDSDDNVDTAVFV